MSNSIDIFKTISNIDSRGLLALTTISTVGAMYRLSELDSLGFAGFALIAYVFSIARSSSEDEELVFYKNILTFAALSYILYTQYNITSYPAMLVILLTIYFLTLMYIGCQNIMKDDRYDEVYRTSCNNKLWYLKWFGIGTSIIATIVCVLYLNGDLDSMYTRHMFPGTGALESSALDPRYRSIFDIQNIELEQEGESLEDVLEDIIGKHLSAQTVRPTTRPTSIEDFLRDPLSSSIASFGSLGTECPSKSTLSTLSTLFL